MAEPKPDANSASRAARQLVLAEEYIYLIAGYILVIAAAGLLVISVSEMVLRILENNYTAAMVHLLDRVLLVLMLAEIIYTIERIARTRRLEATPFLVIGIIAAIRRMLIITAESVGDADLSDPVVQGALTELSLLAVTILLLSVSLFLIHKQKAAEQPKR